MVTKLVRWCLSATSEPFNHYADMGIITMYVLIVFFVDDNCDEYEQVYGPFKTRLEAKKYAIEKNVIKMEDFSCYRIRILSK